MGGKLQGWPLEPPPRDLWAEPIQQYEFPAGQARRIGHWEGVEEVGVAANPCRTGESRFFRLRGLLEPHEVREVLACALKSEAYATDADSVDQMPSFEYYPLSHGAWVDPDMEVALGEALQTRIVPYVRERYGCPSCTVATMLVRRYLPGERRAHSVHFDSQAYVTAVLGLSDPEDFEGGLYIQPGPSAYSRLYPRLEPGDLLLHSFDLQHGVFVSGGSRYSLVLWLKDSRDAVIDGTTPWLEALAESGDVHATHLLAESYEFGDHGRECDVQQAMRLYERSARAGHHWSQNSLGFLYQMQTEHAGAAAMDWWRASVGWFAKAAQSGFAEAQRNLAMTCLDGAAGGSNFALAAGWMHRAAAQLDEEAAFALGEMLRRGSPDGRVPADPRAARRWLARSARAGLRAARQSLAEL